MFHEFETTPSDFAWENPRFGPQPKVGADFRGSVIARFTPTASKVRCYWDALSGDPGQYFGEFRGAGNMRTMAARQFDLFHTEALAGAAPIPLREDGAVVTADDRHGRLRRESLDGQWFIQHSHRNHQPHCTQRPVLYFRRAIMEEKLPCVASVARRVFSNPSRVEHREIAPHHLHRTHTQPRNHARFVNHLFNQRRFGCEGKKNTRHRAATRMTSLAKAQAVRMASGYVSTGSCVTKEGKSASRTR